MKILTYFLPQFYPTPENDKYWGKGFTDWVNVKSSIPLFNGHKQPLSPAKFGMYNLSEKETIKKLSKYSKQYGIDGFGYWHYWFGNDSQTLEKVPEIHLKNQSIEQNFFFAWANQDWTKSWMGDDSTIIFKQLYTEKSAYDHFKYIKKFILDLRYIKINKKPLFQVINPDDIGVKKHIKILEKQALNELGTGFHWLFPASKNIEGLENLTHSRVGYPPGDITKNDSFFKIKRKLQKLNFLKGPIIINEKNYMNAFKKTIINNKKNIDSYFPCLLSGWDNTPRYKNKGFVIDADILSLIKKQFKFLNKIYKNDELPNIVFIKSWNEWAEGNLLEPYKIFNKEYNPSKIILDLKNKFFRSTKEYN